MACQCMHPNTHKHTDSPFKLHSEIQVHFVDLKFIAFTFTPCRKQLCNISSSPHLSAIAIMHQMGGMGASCAAELAQLLSIFGFSPLSEAASPDSHPTLPRTKVTASFLPQGKCLNIIPSCQLFNLWKDQSAIKHIFSPVSIQITVNQSVDHSKLFHSVLFLSVWVIVVVCGGSRSSHSSSSNVTNLHLVHTDRIPPPLGNLSIVPVWFSHPKDFQSTLTQKLCTQAGKYGRAQISAFNIIFLIYSLEFVTLMHACLFLLMEYLFFKPVIRKKNKKR